MSIMNRSRLQTGTFETLYLLKVPDDGYNYFLNGINQHKDTFGEGTIIYDNDQLTKQGCPDLKLEKFPCVLGNNWIGVRTPLQVENSTTENGSNNLGKELSKFPALVIKLNPDQAHLTKKMRTWIKRLTSLVCLINQGEIIPSPAQQRKDPFNLKAKRRGEHCVAGFKKLTDKTYEAIVKLDFVLVHRPNAKPEWL